ncbi:MAG: MATE family efflux transporter [Clostridiales bacterium]|nr:MATE family efflux transporter [Clostridiales bacterium]
MTKDLTVGSPQKVLWNFCLPLFGSVIFQQLYNIADSLVAGKFVGEQALAAVGNSYEITLIFIAISFGFNIGCSVVVSQLFGAKKISNMKTAVYTTYISSIVICLVLMTLGLSLCTPLLKLINTPDEIMADSKLYLYIYILGLPFMFFYNVSTGVFSALGDSKTPFIFLAISSTANIGADILFVTAFGMGVSGVAWATFICQGISSIFATAFILKKLKKIEAEERPKRFSWDILKRILKIAIPSVLQQSFISVGNIIIQGVINSFGASIIAGYSAGIKLNNLVITSFATLGNGISNYTAQNLGAREFKRIKQGFSAGVKLFWSIAIPFALLYFFAGRYLLYLFMDDMTGLAMQTGIQLLRIVSPFYMIAALKLVADGILRGSGMMNRFMTATFTDLILRVVLAIILSRFMGIIGVWIAWPIGWTIAATMSLLFYKNGNLEEKASLIL